MSFPGLDLKSVGAPPAPPSNFVLFAALMYRQSSFDPIDNALVCGRAKTWKQLGSVIDLIDQGYPPGWYAHLWLSHEREINSSALYSSVLF